MATLVKRTADEELALRRRRRSIALGRVLGALAVRVYALTLVTMGSQVGGGS